MENQERKAQVVQDWQATIEIIRQAAVRLRDAADEIDAAVDRCDAPARTGDTLNRALLLVARAQGDAMAKLTSAAFRVWGVAYGLGDLGLAQQEREVP